LESRPVRGPGSIDPPEPVRDAIAGIADWAAAREAAGEGAATEPQGLPRSVRDGAVVELREVTGESVRGICRLQVAPAQRRFVAPNAVSFAEALFEPMAWYRAIVADDVAVGFVMLYLDPAKPYYYLWRLMIADRFQGRGYGRATIGLLGDHIRSLPNATEMLVSFVPGEGSPEGFYLDLGFEPTGDIDEGEVVARLPL
jgi:diamine N-acetyltransferase